jgi:Cof subfamily protein (haloacid dehalogenase superfamily)
MKSYKMLCLDIDGTLVNSEHRITTGTREAIQIVSKEMKIPVILVSARMPKGILFLLEELDVREPIICYSGALVLDDKTNILSNETISIADASKIYSLAREMAVHVSLYRNDEWYVQEMDEWAEQEGEITNSSPVITVLEDLLGVWKKENSGPNKILCMAEPEKLEALHAEIKCCYPDKLNVYPSKPTYLEIMPDNASKPSAIEILCRRFNIDKSEVIAIGDNFNDISMIEYAGLGIAMGNAPQQVKLRADSITLSNDEDGVAAAIRKYILRT